MASWASEGGPWITVDGSTTTGRWRAGSASHAGSRGRPRRPPSRRGGSAGRWTSSRGSPPPPSREHARARRRRAGSSRARQARGDPCAARVRVRALRHGEAVRRVQRTRGHGRRLGDGLNPLGELRGLPPGPRRPDPRRHAAAPRRGQPVRPRDRAGRGVPRRQPPRVPAPHSNPRELAQPGMGCGSRSWSGACCDTASSIRSTTSPAASSSSSTRTTERPSRSSGPTTVAPSRLRDITMTCARRY